MGVVFVFVTVVLVDVLLPLCYRLCVVARRFCFVLMVAGVFDNFINAKGFGSVKPERVCLLLSLWIDIWCCCCEDGFCCCDDCCCCEGEFRSADINCCCCGEGVCCFFNLGSFAADSLKRRCRSFPMATLCMVMVLFGLSLICDSGFWWFRRSPVSVQWLLLIVLCWLILVLVYRLFGLRCKTSQLFGLFFDWFHSCLDGFRCGKSNTCVVILVMCIVSAIGHFVSVILTSNFLVV